MAENDNPRSPRLRMLLRGAYLTMHRRAQALYATVGATVDQSITLALLASAEGLTQNDLVRLTYSDPSTVAALLRLLEKQGYVRRERDARDGRAKRVTLTAAGRRRQRQLNDLRLRHQAPLLECLTSRQRTILFDALERIINFESPGAADAPPAGSPGKKARKEVDPPPKPVRSKRATSRKERA